MNHVEIKPSPAVKLLSIDLQSLKVAARFIRPNSMSTMTCGGRGTTHHALHHQHSLKPALRPLRPFEATKPLVMAVRMIFFQECTKLSRLRGARRHPKGRQNGVHTFRPSRRKDMQIHKLAICVWVVLFNDTPAENPLFFFHFNFGLNDRSPINETKKVSLFF